MARKVFYSFRYDVDAHRVQQVKNMGIVEGQPILSSNAWENVAKNGEAAIQKWINDNLRGTSCDIVLIGSGTAGRKWVNYEFTKSWADGKGVFGVHVHGLKDLHGGQDPKGRNPFTGFTLGEGANKQQFDKVVKTYDPPYSSSTSVYSYISQNLLKWVESAIEIRRNH